MFDFFKPAVTAKLPKTQATLLTELEENSKAIKSLSQELSSSQPNTGFGAFSLMVFSAHNFSPIFMKLELRRLEAKQTALLNQFDSTKDSKPYQRLQK